MYTILAISSKIWKNCDRVLYKGFSRYVTRSLVCLVIPLIGHFGGQAFGVVYAAFEPLFSAIISVAIIMLIDYLYGKVDVIHYYHVKCHEDL